MEKEKLEALLIDYIDGNLSEEDRAVIEGKIAGENDVRILYHQLLEVMTVMDKAAAIEPQSSLRTSFNSFIEEEVRKNEKTKVILFTPSFYRIAASLLILITLIGVGNLIYKDHQREKEFQAMQKEIAATKERMMAMMDNESSASQRILGVNVAMNIERADNEIVEALAKRMNDDPNTNVRMAALEALSKFHEEPAVRKVLIKSLSEQKDPVVQIALIQLLVRMKEKEAVKSLERITDDNATMKAVKDEAYSGILKLS